MAKKFWMQEAAEKMKKKGTVGSFTKSAKKAGKGVHEYAEEKKHASGTLGKRARFALAAAKAKH